MRLLSAGQDAKEDIKDQIDTRKLRSWKDIDRCEGIEPISVTISIISLKICVEEITCTMYMYNSIFKKSNKVALNK